MKPIEIITQVLELIAALAVAPLFLGWINQCRAWLQNRRAPVSGSPTVAFANSFTRMP